MLKVWICIKINAYFSWRWYWIKLNDNIKNQLASTTQIQRLSLKKNLAEKVSSVFLQILSFPDFLRLILSSSSSALSTTTTPSNICAHSDDSRAVTRAKTVSVLTRCCCCWRTMMMMGWGWSSAVQCTGALLRRLTRRFVSHVNVSYWRASEPLTGALPRTHCSREKERDGFSDWHGSGTIIRLLASIEGQSTTRRLVVVARQVRPNHCDMHCNHRTDIVIIGSSSSSRA